MRRPLIVGSVAFDLLFDIHGRIQDEILVGKSGKLGRQNLMFTAKDRKEHFGGVGANISYGLGLLGVKPLLFSVAGEDYNGAFRKHLVAAGVDARVVVKKGFTATFFGMSDEEGQQIGVYQPNTYAALDSTSLSATIRERDWKEISVALVAGTGASILRHMKEIRSKKKDGITIIFDPGQIISIFYDKTLLEATLRLADIFIGNEVEIKQLQAILGYNIEKVLQKGVRAVIETLGEKGSTLYEYPGEASNADRRYLLRLQKTRISAVKAKRVVETTGAGDAYRAGLIAKLLEGKTLKEACAFGAHIAARSVAFRGGQTYRLAE